jgi:hypothetical protein
VLSAPLRCDRGRHGGTSHNTPRNRRLPSNRRVTAIDLVPFRLPRDGQFISLCPGLSTAYGEIVLFFTMSAERSCRELPVDFDDHFRSRCNDAATGTNLQVQIVLLALAV